MEKTNPNRAENRFQTNLMVLMHTLLSDRDAYVKRVTAYGDGRWARRDTGLLISLVDRLQQTLLKTMPEKRIDFYRRMTREAQIVISWPGPAKTSREILIDAEDLGAIAEAAMTGVCAMCLKEGRDVKRCRLREALMVIAPPAKVSGFTCEYRDPALALDLGEEIKL